MDSNKKREALKEGTYVLCVKRDLSLHEKKFEFLDTGTIMHRAFYEGFVVVLSHSTRQFLYAEIRNIIPLLGKQK